MQPLGTKVYLLKRYSPSDSFCTFFSESALASIPAYNYFTIIYDYLKIFNGSFI